MKGKTVAESKTIMTEIVLPNDANTHGNILGGKVMHLMDLAGAVAAIRHARSPVVTASVDSLSFLHPIRVGQLVILEALLTRAFRTSMEVRVDVYSEEPITGERRHTSTAYLTFVALGRDGKPRRVPKLIPLGEEEKRRHHEALLRRRRRLREKQGSAAGPRLS